MNPALTALETYLRRYHRHEIHVDAVVPDQPVLFVSNHGFGGLVDLNVLAFFGVQHAGYTNRPTIGLVHQMAWTVGAGKLAEAIGGRPASREAADAAFAEGKNVLVFPGGDIDASKSWRQRNEILFCGRSGFANLAMCHEVPIVAIVTAGAGESALVLSDGQRLARALQLPRLLRTKSMAISLSIPWGLSFGVAGMLPYVPLPTKLETAILPAMTPEPGESAEAFAHRVQIAMQSRLDGLVANRRPIVG